jgi:hypothetical protein
VSKLSDDRRYRAVGVRNDVQYVCMHRRFTQVSSLDEL